MASKKKEVRLASIVFTELYLPSLATANQKSPGLLAKLDTFYSFKKNRPPTLLPSGFRDHMLGGRLLGFSECHLDGDACLIYTDKADIVELVIIVDHDELEGPKERALAKRIIKFRK